MKEIASLLQWDLTGVELNQDFILQCLKKIALEVKLLSSNVLILQVVANRVSRPAIDTSLLALQKQDPPRVLSSQSQIQLIPPKQSSWHFWANNAQLEASKIPEISSSYKTEADATTAQLLGQNFANR